MSPTMAMYRVNEAGVAYPRQHRKSSGADGLTFNRPLRTINDKAGEDTKGRFTFGFGGVPLPGGSPTALSRVAVIMTGCWVVQSPRFRPLSTGLADPLRNWLALRRSASY